MSSRSRSRQFALQMIYQHHFNQEKEPEDMFSKFWTQLDVDAKTKSYAESLVVGVLDNAKMLEMEIMAFLQNWSLDRIALTDRIVLQIAIFELIHCKEVPWKVVVNEACTLAKLFSGNQSINYINGILHNWCEHSGVATPGAVKEQKEIPSSPQGEGVDREPGGS